MILHRFSQNDPEELTLLSEKQQKAMFKDFAKAMNKAYDVLDAKVGTIGTTPVLQFFVFPNVRWEVHHANGSPRLILSQFFIDDDNAEKLIQPECFFQLGPTQLEIDDTEAKREGNLLWIMWRLTTTYFWMIKDKTSGLEKGFDPISTLTAAAHLRPLYVMAVKNFSMDIEQLADLFHVHGPYLRPVT
jgi:hypothetical protein